MAQRRIAVVVSRFNQTVTDRLLDGAREAAQTRGSNIEETAVFPVPGAFELPVVAMAAARSGRFDAIVCLGAVIRGETPHFEYVSAQAATGIQRVSLDTGIPVAFGVLTTDTMEQALERAGGRVGNKGYDAVIAVLQTLEQLERAGRSA